MPIKEEFCSNGWMADLFIMINVKILGTLILLESNKIHLSFNLSTKKILQP